MAVVLIAVAVAVDAIRSDDESSSAPAASQALVQPSPPHASPAELLRGNAVAVTLSTAFNLARAFAWSPDGRFLAAATRASIFVLDTTDLERLDRSGLTAALCRLPIIARDVGWIASRE